MLEPLCNSHETTGKIKILQRPNTKDSSIQWQIPVIDFIYIFNKFLNWTNSALKFNTLSLFVGIQCCLREIVVYYTCLSLKFFLLKCFTFERKKKFLTLEKAWFSFLHFPTFYRLEVTCIYILWVTKRQDRKENVQTGETLGECSKTKIYIETVNYWTISACIKIFWTQKFPTIDIERIKERSNRKSECQIENEAKYIHVFRFILCCWCFGFFF